VVVVGASVLLPQASAMMLAAAATAAPVLVCPMVVRMEAQAALHQMCWRNISTVGQSRR
jgi:hypothetical protein